jgi:probable addiction module antidote protein
MTLKDFNKTFEQELQDSEYAALYLKLALQDNGIEGFLLALRNVIQATRGMTEVAAETALGRESLYKALSESGNPQFTTIQKVLSVLGLQLAIEPLAPADTPGSL